MARRPPARRPPASVTGCAMAPPWTPINDYAGAPRDLAHGELRALESVWREQRGRLEGNDAFRSFNERLKREWAIETGLIERLYVLDRGVTRLLIERGLDAALIPHGAVRDPRNVLAMIGDHEAAVEAVFDFVKRRRALSTSYVKEIHALITRHQDTVEGVDQFGRTTRVPLVRGDYKKWPNDPATPDGEAHPYCPPEHVASEMDRLIDMHRAHVDAGVPPEVEAAWLHHRFTQIHPFQDGNGRVARALATLVFVRSGWFPLVVRDRERAAYIDALEAADGHDLRPLVGYFADLQRAEFVNALSIARSVLQSIRAEDAIRAVRKDLQRRRESLIEEWNAARDTADRLRERAERRLQDVSAALQDEMEGLFERMSFFTDGAEEGAPDSHYYRFQIVTTARALGYFANTDAYRSWVRLVMRNADQSELLIAFHGIGHEFQGVLACSACWFQRVETGKGEREVGGIEPMTDRVFQINYKEPPEAAEERFMPWLEDCIVRAIGLWQATAL